MREVLKTFAFTRQTNIEVNNLKCKAFACTIGLKIATRFVKKLFPVSPNRH